MTDNTTTHDSGAATSELLKDVKPADVASITPATTLYRCGVKPTFGFDVQIHVAGVTFATRTYRREGTGEAEKEHEYSCSYQQLTSEQVERLKAALAFQFVRFTKHPTTGQRVGVEVIDASDGGDAVNGKPPKLVRGRLVPGDEPLAPFLVFEPCQKFEGHAVTAEELKLRRAAEIEAENEDFVSHAAGTAALRNELATGTAGRKPSAGRM